VSEQTIEMEDIFEIEEIKALIDTFPSFEAKVLTLLRLKQDQRLFEVFRETDIAKKKFALVQLCVNETVNLSYSRWKEIFQNYSTDYVKRMASNKEDSKQSSLTYGEIDFFSFANILERAQPCRGDVFVDLGYYIFDFIFYYVTGHGIGKGLVCAAVLYGHLLRKSYGVEIVETLNSISVDMVERYHSSLQEDSIFSDHQCQISVEQGDLLSESISANWTEAGTHLGINK
jgi:hypothetical protein